MMIRASSTSFLDLLRRAQRDALTAPPDPWLEKLTRLYGVMGPDGIERVSTSEVLDHLEVPTHLRARSTRRLAKVMMELGWRPMRVRTVSANGFYARLRGFARSRPMPKHSTAS